MTPEDWFSICLIGAPTSRMLVSANATPPPRLESCRAELMDRPIDSMLSSMRRRKQETSSPRWRFAGVEERGGGRLEAAVDDLVDHLLGELLVAAGQVQGDHADAVLVALEVALAVERLQRVRGVVLESAEEGLEAELLGVGALEEVADEVHRVLVERLTLVVLVLHQVVELLLEVVEENRVVVHVLQEVLVRSLAVGVELDLPVRSVQVEHRVQLVIAQVLEAVGRGSGCARLRLCNTHVQNSSNPLVTRSTSSDVPMTSNLYSTGTWHLAAMMSAARQ